MQPGEGIGGCAGPASRAAHGQPENLPFIDAYLGRNRNVISGVYRLSKGKKVDHFAPPDPGAAVICRPPRLIDIAGPVLPVRVLGVISLEGRS
jgi:hypothetical protein